MGRSCKEGTIVTVGTGPAAEEVFRLPDEGEEGGLLGVGRVAVGGYPRLTAM